ncbi:MAG: RidA family protein [bacterium]|nr:RidA family protein [bacterium]
MPKEQIVSEKVKPVAAYSTGFKCSGGSLIMLAGMVAADVDGKTVGKGDMGAQTQKVFENIRDTLEAAGASLKDIIRLTVYITDRALFPDHMKVRMGFVSEPYPASTLLIISGLANPDWLVEIDAVAFVADE